MGEEHNFTFDKLIIQEGKKEMEKTVEIPISEYAEFIEAFNNAALHIRALKNSASLNYSKNGLRFDDDTLNVIYKLLDPEGYEELVQKLKEEEAEAEK